MWKKHVKHHSPVFFASVVCIALVAVALSDFFGVFAVDTANFSLAINPGYECYDGLDNDGNGLEDYPADPGCDSYTDDSEVTVVSGGGGGGSGVSSIYHPPTSAVTSTGSSAFHGVTIPNALVRILQDGVLVDEVRANSAGVFSIMVGSLGDGLHGFNFIAITDLGNSVSFSLPIMRNGNETTETTGIVLSPVIRASVTSITKGGDVQVFGYAQPSVPVQIEVHSSAVIVQSLETDMNGYFSFTFSTDGLEEGEHSVIARAFISGGWSAFSPAWQFTVGGETVYPPIEETVCRADVNRDGRVNLVDLSVLEVWFEKPLNEEMRTVEKNCFNGDGKISPADLSILAYYWTG